MNLQVTVLKILVSYPDGFAPMAELRRDMAILATSGRDWAERTRRLAARVPNLDIFSQKLIGRINGGWRITDKGRTILEVMEARPVRAEERININESSLGANVAAKARAPANEQVGAPPAPIASTRMDRRSPRHRQRPRAPRSGRMIRS
ncbi:hypothetical protein ML401_37905 (plasmid) [Bradyrhizobium sp. 62B]|uniref:hypothetical protein n=1 Tax=Bradyrhizobium sp. 62B TaxID=2898442 RepID=UPI002557EEB4|nr:hypothetical protein ML401_37905 [Bradyrhizobium sp. 62B]